MSTFSWDEQNRRTVVEGREVVERLPTSLGKNSQLNTKCHSSNNNHHYSKMHHATVKTETILKLFGLKGKPWSSFGDIAGDISSSSSSSSDDDEDHEKNTSQKSSALSSETVPNSSSHLNNNGPRASFVGRTGRRSANKIMRLNRQDMSLYGLCPQTDPFFVVICGTCRKVLRPQGLQRHIEIRHKGKQQDVNNDVANHISDYHQLLEPPTQPIPRKPQPPVAVCNGTISSSNGMLMEVAGRDHTLQQQREPKGASSDGKDGSGTGGSKRNNKVQFTRPTTHNTTSSTTNTNTRNTFENFTNTDTSSQFTTISTSSATSKSWGTGGSGSSISSSSSSSSSTTSTSLDSFNSSSSTSNSPLSLTNELYDGIAAIERKRVETKENVSRRARKQSLPKTPQTEPAIASRINTPNNQSSRYNSHHSSTSNSRSQKRKVISKEPVDTEEPQRKAQKRLPELKMPKLPPPLLEMINPYYNQNGNDPDLHQQAPSAAPSRISLPLDVILPMNIDLINLDTTVAGTQLEITGTNQQQQSVTINHMGMPELTLLRDNNSPPPLLALVPQNHTNMSTLYTGTNEHYMNDNRINLLMMSPPPPPPPVPMNGTIYDCFDPAGTIYDQILLTELENGDENIILSSDDDDDDGKSIDFKELKVLRNMDKEETSSLRSSTLTPATPKPVAYNNFNMRGIGGGSYVMATQRKFIELKKSLKNDDNYSNSTKTLPKTWSFIERHHLLLPVVRLTQ